ncbi:MAG: APC family permease, partial [Myxococcales bacterium]|nr:APC family permease [Myxococcales bacterium]
LAGLVALCNALSSAQLAARFPVSGGTYEYANRLLNGPLGFAAGWMFICAKSASAATAALGCSGYALHVLGAPNDRWVRVGVALALVLVLTVLVARGVRRSNQVNIVIVSLTLGTLAMFVIFGLLSASDLDSKMASLATVFRSPATLLEATALMFVAYTGYGRIATLGEEVQDPARTIPRAIIATLMLSMVLYLAVSSTAVLVAGAEEFAASTAAAAAPLEVVARSFRHPWVAAVVAFGAVTAMAGVLLNLLLGLSRVLLAMARRRDMPAALDQVDERHQSPTRAVWAIGGLIGCLVLIGDVKATWSFSAFTVLVYYGLTNLAALRLPPEFARFPRWIAWAGLVSCFCLAFFVEWQVWLLGSGILILGFIWRSVSRAVQRPSAS